MSHSKPGSEVRSVPHDLGTISRKLEEAQVKSVVSSLKSIAQKYFYLGALLMLNQNILFMIMPLIDVETTVQGLMMSVNHLP